MIVAFGVFVVSSIKTYDIFTRNNEISIPQADAKISHEYTAAEIPVRILIPSIGVDTAIKEVGVTDTGNMASPHGLTDVGWYKYGPLPGTLGSAVIAGHLDNAVALNGVFKRLSELKPGDDIYVENGAGTRVHFQVKEKDIYPYNNAPADRIFNAKGTPSLNLITCAGTWNQPLKTYDKRVVVYTELVP